MKRFLLLFLYIILSIPLLAQLEVKEGSFKEVPGFVNINPDDNYQTDDNNLPFAVIKVRTENINDKQRRELKFKGNAGTFILLEYKDGEVWVYLTAKYADYLKISHPDFSSTEFTLPYDLQPKKGYEMILVNKTNYTPLPDKPEYNYLIIKTDQQNALIYIDDIFVGEKEVSKSFKAGENHKWRIDCDYYYSESGETNILLGEPIIIDKELRPAFGYINVTSEPENGAIVFIDGKKVGVTPYKSDRLKSGAYSVKVVKEMFNTTEQTISVTDGNSVDVKLKMSTNFVTVSVTTDSDSQIYIDNEKKGRGKWTGRLTEGEHVFEAKKEAHKTSIKNIKLNLGKDESITIPDPEPIYGVLDVNTTPIGADVYIDGKKQGTSPRVISDVLIGKHSVRIEKDGYNPETREIIITENNKIDLNVQLSQGKEITIETGNFGDKVFIDGKEVGKSPIRIILSYGKHTISAYNGNKSDTKEISISPSSETNSVKLVLAKASLSSYIDNGYKFIALNVSMSQYNRLSYGLTLGNVNKYGWFVSAMSNFNFNVFNSNYECDENFYVNGFCPEYTGKVSYTSLSVIAGTVVKVSGPIALRIGAGYGVKTTLYETISGAWIKNTAISCQGLDVSAGLQINIRGLVVSLDCVTTNFKIYEAKIGLGYGLKNK